MNKSLYSSEFCLCRFPFASFSFVRQHVTQPRTPTRTTRARRLPTWDGMLLPLPFGRGILVIGEPIPVPREGWESSLPAIEAALTQAALRAEALTA